MKQPILIPAILIPLSILIVGVSYVATYHKLTIRKLMNEARYHCALSSRFTTKDSAGNEVWYPVKELYENCLKEKGI